MLAFGESAVVEAASLEVVVVQAAEPPAVEQENPKVEWKGEDSPCKDGEQEEEPEGEESACEHEEWGAATEQAIL